MKTNRFNYFFMAGLLLALHLLCLQSCEVKCEDCAGLGGQHHVVLTLEGSASQTKALDVPSLSESNVVRCLLYIFDQQGKMVKVLSSSEGAYDFYLVEGTYDFVAVANKAGLVDEEGTEFTKDDLMSVIAALADNSVGNFVMAGSLDRHLIQGDENLTIEVRRLVSKVTYKVRTEFKGSLAEADFKIDDIFMTNVVGHMDLACTEVKPAATDVWFNEMNFNPTDLSISGYPGDLIYGRIDHSMAMPKDSIETGHTFYVYPNESADNHDKDTWSPRCTRFVVKATLAGKTTYYPVTIAAVGRNKHYHIDLTITNYGVDHPEDIPEKYEYITATIVVADWETGGTIHSTY